MPPNGPGVSMHPPAIGGGAHLHRQQYLFGFAPLGEVIDHVRSGTAKEEIDRLPEIAAAWTAIQPDIRAILTSEAGLSETILVEDLPPDKSAQAAVLIDDELLQRSFNLKTTVALVEIDKLVAAQRRVNLDYVDQLFAELPEMPDLDFLIQYCLTPKRSVAPIQHLQLGDNHHIFSSPNGDLRFLGSFLKELTPADLEYAERGGIPAMAIVSFVGYGDSPINVFWSGTRAVLNNGFHRVYALRHRGVRRIPALIQVATNVPLEFPSRVIDLPRDYLLTHPRPVLMKDFFEKRFNIVLRVQNRLRTVTIRSNVEQHDVPW